MGRGDPTCLLTKGVSRGGGRVFADAMSRCSISPKARRGIHHCGVGMSSEVHGLSDVVMGSEEVEVMKAR